jgi:hypothetical protein
MPERTAESLSPELILVSPPEEAALAREQLPHSPASLRSEALSEPPSEDPAEAAWTEFLADVRSRPVDPVVAARTRRRAPAPVGRKGRRRLLVATVAIVAVGAVVGLGWARDRAQQEPGARTTPARAGFVPTRVWSWAEAPGAGAYVVRFVRDGHEVLKIRTVAPRLVLPPRFNFTPGRYRWTVKAVPQEGKRGHVIVDSSFTVGASNG